MRERDCEREITHLQTLAQDVEVMEKEVKSTLNRKEEKYVNSVCVDMGLSHPSPLTRLS